MEILNFEDPKDYFIYSQDHTWSWDNDKNITWHVNKDFDHYDKAIIRLHVHNIIAITLMNIMEIRITQFVEHENDKNWLLWLGEKDTNSPSNHNTWCEDHGDEDWCI